MSCEKGRLSVHVPEMADDESHSYWASPTFSFYIFYNNEEGGALRSKIEISALGEDGPKKLIDPFERQSEERLHRILMSSLSIQPFRPFDHTKRKPLPYMESGLALDPRIASPETGRHTKPPRTPLARRMLWMVTLAPRCHGGIPH